MLFVWRSFDRWSARIEISTAFRWVSGGWTTSPSPGVSVERQASYLVDSSSSHMLVSKIKPCMSKYKPQQGETANGSLNHT